MDLYQVNDGSPNHFIHPSKIIKLNSSGADWTTALLGPGINTADYIAPGLVLTVEDPESIEFKSNMVRDYPLQALLDKLSKGTPGKIASLVSKVGDVAAGLAGSATGKTALNLVPPNVRFQTTLSQLPAWKSSEAAGISDIKFKFYFGQAGQFDGRTEVYNPVILLSRVNVPDLVGQNSHLLRGPLPSVAYIYGALGASVAASVSALANNILGSATPGTLNPSEVANQAASRESSFEQKVDALLTGMENQMWNAMQGFKGIMTMTMGTRIFLPAFSVGETKFHFGTEVDDYGFPIYGEVTWSDIKTIQLVHTGMPQYQMYGPVGKADQGTAFPPTQPEPQKIPAPSGNFPDANALPTTQDTAGQAVPTPNLGAGTPYIPH